MWLPEPIEGPSATYPNGHPRDWITQDADVLAAEAEMLDRVNALRVSIGRAALVPDATLARIARGHSHHMDTDAFFDHVNPEGEGPAERACALGVHGLIGENLALGYDTPESAFNAWIASRPHLENMTAAAYTTAGVGRHAWRWTLTLRAP